MRAIFLAVFFNFSWGYTQTTDSIQKFVNDSTHTTSQRFKIPAALDSLWQREFLSFPAVDSINPISTKNPAPETVLSTETLKDRLKILNSKTPIQIEYSPVLERTIQSYLTNRRGAFEYLIALSNYYFPLFEEIFDREGVPLEVKYLAVVESMLKPSAKSPVGATGLWQFMFSTAKHYNLEVSSYVDERCDPLRATVAAAKYLSRLYAIFGDWNLAMAAYNSGPGNVTKAMRRSGGHTNYWNIRPFLPKETADYIPRFLATMYMFEFASNHGLRAKISQFHLSKTDTVSVKEMISFDHIQQILNVDLKTIKFLNPSYKLGIIPAIDSRDYKLRLPIEMIGPFVAQESQIYSFAQQEFQNTEKPLPKFFKMDSKIRYNIQSGDYLGKIAKKFKVRVSDIKRWNNMKTDNLRAGQRITIFTRNLDYQPDTEAPLEQDSKRVYVVQKGDSLWSISQKFSGVSVENLKKWNGISGVKLQPGMRLVISK